MGTSTPPPLLLLAISSLLITTCIAAKNINTTRVLAKFDNLSTFNKYLSETGVVKEIDGRSSLTVLALSNSALDPLIASVGPNNLLVIADVLRYHCILQYLEIPEIKSMTNSTGILLTTLLQTTGRAVQQAGFMNVSVSKGVIHLSSPNSPTSNATILKSISTHPYDMSYVEIDRPLLPSGVGLQQGSGGASTRLANLTATLKARGSYNNFLALLSSTGLDASLKSISALTLLAPTDDAFKALPPNALASLKQAEKISLLQFHAIPTYFTMGSLGAVTTPLPTLASATAGGFTLNVSSGSDKSVSFLTGLNKAEVVDTLMDDPPVAAYSLNRVLLSPELFGLASGPAPALAPGAPELSPSPSPSSGPSPSSSPSPSPSPVVAPAPAPVPASVPAASPPAPPTSGPAGEEAPEVSPGTAPPNGATGVSSGVLGLGAAMGMAALLL